MKLSELPKRDLIDDFNDKVVQYNREVEKGNFRLLPWPNLRDVLLTIAVGHTLSTWMLALLT